jgi:hypothetical protein
VIFVGDFKSAHSLTQVTGSIMKFHLMGVILYTKIGYFRENIGLLGGKASI